ncbi:MAG: Hpt domain-containing protein [Syntrophorhabdaceae bacterium]|nr:Hpt domain-containing protein [Syntrophorhabdaceae bacterium]
MRSNFKESVMAIEGDKIIVHIDPDLEDLIPGYLENRHNDIRKIKDALKEGDYDTIRILGHSMKGSGGGYGFDAITDIGKSIEQAAKNKDKEAIKMLVEELNDYLNRVKIIYG